MLTRVTETEQIEIDSGDLDAPLIGVIPEDADAAAEEPLVDTAEESRAAEAYRDLTALLIRGVESGEISEDVEPVFDEEWFENEEASQEPEADSDDDNLNMFRPRF
jgi:MinD-like ATPase involved in chromosome partitioning or flagellar assembly